MNYVYVITNTSNGKRYVGVTNNPERRWRTHKHIAVTPGRVRYLIHDAIAKYGAESFTFEIVEQHENRDDAFLAESKFVREYDSLGENGYNLNSGGVGPIKFSERTRQKISEAARKRFSSESERKRHSDACKGSTRSEETRKRMSESQRGRIQSESTRQKIREKKLGVKLNFTEEHRKFLGERLRQLSQTKEHSERVKEMNFRRRGTHLSREHRAKLGRSICQISLETGLVLRTFSTIKEASEALQIPYQHLYRCVKGDRDNAGGFRWSYTQSEVQSAHGC